MPLFISSTSTARTTVLRYFYSPTNLLYSTVEISIFGDISGDILPLNYSANDGPTCERA